MGDCRKIRLYTGQTSRATSSFLEGLVENYSSRSVSDFVVLEGLVDNS
jgi:hypothetical protein